MQLKIEIVSDVICPWCFIGKRRFEKALQLMQPGIETEVHWRPFELNPDMPAGGMDRKLYRTRKFGNWERSQALDAQLREAGAGEGIHFAFDRMERTPNTSMRIVSSGWLIGKVCRMRWWRRCSGPIFWTRATSATAKFWRKSPARQGSTLRSSWRAGKGSRRYAPTSHGRGSRESRASRFS